MKCNKCVCNFCNSFCKKYALYGKYRSQNIVSLSENRRKYQLKNENHKCIHTYKVDNGIITSQDIPKCDYAIFIETNSLYLIELKGANISRAIEQIESTIRILIQEEKVNVNTIEAKVVLSKGRNPKIISTKQQHLDKLLSRYNGRLTYKEQIFIDSI